MSNGKWMNIEFLLKNFAQMLLIIMCSEESRARLITYLFNTFPPQYFSVGKSAGI
jgi:hypothetical protein